MDNMLHCPVEDKIRLYRHWEHPSSDEMSTNKSFPVYPEEMVARDKFRDVFFYQDGELLVRHILTKGSFFFGYLTPIRNLIDTEFERTVEDVQVVTSRSHIPQAPDLRAGSVPGR